jgi:hypothetical protein
VQAASDCTFRFCARRFGLDADGQRGYCKNMGSSPDQLLQFLDYHYAVLCKCCGKKVMDPDKKKGQTHLKGKCPSCNKDSKEEKKSKKQRKKERQEQQRKQQNKECRAKY